MRSADFQVKFFLPTTEDNPPPTDAQLRQLQTCPRRCLTQTEQPEENGRRDSTPSPRRWHWRGGKVVTARTSLIIVGADASSVGLAINSRRQHGGASTNGRLVDSLPPPGRLSDQAPQRRWW
jgi:hypothetical protein